MNKQKLIVIGNGMVGQNFLEGMVEAGGLDQYEIITFCEEPRPAYDRVHLSEYFTGKTAEDLSLVTPSFFNDHGIIIHLGDKVDKIDRTRKLVFSANGLEISTIPSRKFWPTIPFPITIRVCFFISKYRCTLCFRFKAGCF